LAFKFRVGALHFGQFDAALVARRLAESQQSGQSEVKLGHRSLGDRSRFLHVC
jgi:hypothetical protein